MDATRDAVVAAYLELSVKDQDWVRLSQLRPLVPADRAQVDEVLAALVRTGLAHVAPESDRRSLTAADDAAGVRVGREVRHLLAIENDYFELED